MNPRQWSFVAVCLVAAGCGASHEDRLAEQVPASLTVSAAGSVPTGLPKHLSVGLFEGAGQTWMTRSGVPWDARYAYFTKGWVCNWGWDKTCSGSWGLSYLKEGANEGYLPAVAYYVMNGEPGGGEAQFLAKVQTASTMADYFGDFKVMMKVAKEYGKPMLIVLEPDGWGFLESQSGANPNAYAAVAASGLPELAGLPNTVAGFGMAFLQLRNAVGASNAILTMHVSAWADGNDIAYYDVTDALGPHVATVYAFLAPLGLGPNQTGSTFDLLSGDPLDRDSDYYALVLNQDRWWDASDTASVDSRSFNRYAAWLGLWNQKAGKRWVLWQIPLGNSNHLDVCNSGSPRQGYKDNRPEYFFAGAPSGDTHHLASWAQDGVIALLFGAGAGCQSSFQNDTYTDGQLFMKSRVGAFYARGGLPLDGSGTATDAGADGAGAPTFAVSASASPATVAVGGSEMLTATVTDTTGAVTGAIVDLELYDSSGNKVAQQSYSNQAFATGTASSFRWSPVVPGAAGTYRMAIGVFGANWSPLYAWNGSAATFTVATSDPAQYGFESGTQGWASTGGMITRVSTSTAQSFAGASSLAVQFAGSGTQSVYVSSPATPAGATVTFHVWVPAGSGLSWIQPYVQQSSSGGWTWTGNWQPMSSLKANAWNTLSVVVPSNAATPLYQLGVQFSASTSWSGTAYVDSVGW